MPYVLWSQRASAMLACWHKVVDDLDGSRVALVKEIADAGDRGEESNLPTLYGHLAITEVWAGRYQSARDAIATGDRLWAGVGAVPLALTSADCTLAVLTADSDRARAAIGDLRSGDTAPPPTADMVHCHILGLAALLDGDDETAVTELSRAYALARDIGIHEPGRRHRLEGDLGQALVSAGRLDEATALAAEQRDLGESTGRPALTGVAHRISGLVRAASGDLDQAVRDLELAVSEHERCPLPLERGRSLLALGQVQRRRIMKAEANQAFRAALDCFTAIGATAFAGLVSDEINRGKRAVGAGTSLTPTERQVADLVATGMTNREVAARLFASVRTVEGHLASIYRKLGIRSRSELAATYPTRHETDPAPVRPAGDAARP
jgi:DNA-binding CsgD family transcriptional regulator